jgi:hypothetical protein
VATTPIIYTAAEFGAYMSSEVEKWGGGEALGRQAGLIRRRDHFDTFWR